MRSFVDVGCCARSRWWPTPANGMGGLVAPEVFEGLPFELEILFAELDGTFPNHPPDPIHPENLKDLQARVLEVGADVGLAFDGDADRVFLVDEKAEPMSGSTTTAMVAKAILEKHPGATIIYNLICSKAVPEIIVENGGTPVRTRVGHSFIKSVMAETDAVFGGEHSGHYYFRDNYRADSGLIAALVVLEQLSRGRRAAVGAAQAVRALRRLGRDQRRGRRPPGRHRAGGRGLRRAPTRSASTGSPSTSATGGSTCARRTPSRCCGSTSRPPTRRRARPTSPRCAAS